MHPIVIAPKFEEILNAFYGNELQFEFTKKCLYYCADWYLIDGKIYFPYYALEAFGIFSNTEMVFEYDAENCFVHPLQRRYNDFDEFYSA